eukprot:7100957-Prymnesium_polylepis.1
MVSATFGDEMWSARGIGKYRLEKSIAVRQGCVPCPAAHNQRCACETHASRAVAPASFCRTSAVGVHGTSAVAEALCAW